MDKVGKYVVSFSFAMDSTHGIVENHRTQFPELATFFSKLVQRIFFPHIFSSSFSSEILILCWNFTLPWRCFSIKNISIFSWDNLGSSICVIQICFSFERDLYLKFVHLEQTYFEMNFLVAINLKKSNFEPHQTLEHLNVEKKNLLVFSSPEDEI